VECEILFSTINFLKEWSSLFVYINILVWKSYLKNKLKLSLLLVVDLNFNNRIELCFPCAYNLDRLYKSIQIVSNRISNNFTMFIYVLLRWKTTAHQIHKKGRKCSLGHIYWVMVKKFYICILQINKTFHKMKDAPLIMMLTNII